MKNLLKNKILGHLQSFMDMFTTCELNSKNWRVKIAILFL